LVVKPKSTGGFYREDAARLASEAARTPLQQEVAPAPAAPEPPRAPVQPAIPQIEVDRPRLRPDPADNQNVRRPRPVTRLDEDDDEPRHWGVGRIVAWVLLAPWYVTMAAAAIGVDVLFVKDLLGL
jgi:hypothetical protein